MGIAEEVVFCRHDEACQPRWRCFDGLVDVVEARRLDDVLPTLAAVDKAVAKGLYVAGMVSYEAAPAFDDALAAHDGAGLPLAWFALFRRMEERNSPSKGTAPFLLTQKSGRSPDFTLAPWSPSVSRSQYNEAIDRIKDYIARGHTYQVNYTFRLRAAFEGEPWGLFRRLCEAQRGQYNAYLDLGGHVLCSASPELFFSVNGDVVSARPMKGTAPRGRTADEDRLIGDQLRRCEKNRAENAMIVDMMRNDLGRIAERGSVRVESAFDIETYPTVFQMTSTVSARSKASAIGILRAAFPAASITGAPKIRTMEIIQELEPEPRGVYCGAIGWIAPDRRAEFNVAIRTVAIDRATGVAEYGVGGGIVWDSDRAGEYDECRTKAAVLAAGLCGL